MLWLAACKATSRQSIVMFLPAIEACVRLPADPLTCACAAAVQVMEEGGFGFGLLRRTIESYRAMPAAAAPLVRLDTDAGKLNSWVVLQSHVAGFNMAPYYKSWGWPVSSEVATALASLPAFVLGSSKADSGWVDWANADISTVSGVEAGVSKGVDIWAVAGSPGASDSESAAGEGTGASFAAGTTGNGSTTVAVTTSNGPARGNATAGAANIGSKQRADLLLVLLAAVWSHGVLHHL